jgi:hypothetical protein
MYPTLPVLSLSGQEEALVAMFNKLKVLSF